jgi:phosphoglycerate dehydrogenase-like enzyme
VRPARPARAGARAGPGVRDVFPVEPPPADHPLFALPNVLLSPHLAGSSEAALAATAEAVADAILRFAAGRLPPGRLTPAARPSARPVARPTGDQP